MKNRVNSFSETLKIILIPILAVFLTSCTVTTGLRPGGSLFPPPAGPEPISIIQPERAALYHAVAPGETLWRIGKMYDVDARTLMRVNRIKNVKDLDIGKRLYIPEAAPRKDIITLYPNRKWKYIIIHHSATDKGNSENFDMAHKNRGWQGVGYHFVIDNGTCGKENGQIETTPRWIKQLDGAHCKVGGMNSDGIGICLVGNFSEEEVSARQMRSLVILTQKLKNYYNIPSSRVMGHKDVPGAQTECPGTRFPWKKFRSEIR
ncbi:MAG: N-acetylmuramoyl-L-alanine amidase [Candidatus Omnitrophica bacterium]|nr:N-acetylmuramoyl-L-alanine amidase [Candidatus Omnitrophota bacterium]MBU1128917.1 N-acetylmuramoyl-L-alanine amidase [Candidatus Omnitrophota bacterium]MBU1784921.1 N-acetylmuramoyl-L-alanine amidase [Candidatus Omnitrophota bacterium]MBU1852093.1 N-acetylmuramoyl-L-alanine amidase [Candidatus Omnitrophota bacterium]